MHLVRHGGTPMYCLGAAVWESMRDDENSRTKIRSIMSVEPIYEGVSGGTGKKDKKESEQSEHSTRV